MGKLTLNKILRPNSKLTKQVIDIESINKTIQQQKDLLIIKNKNIRFD